MRDANARTPAAYWAFAGAGLFWNLFGIVQFTGQFHATPAMLMAKGMTVGQAALMADQPSWMIVAFALGVFGGTIGAVLLLARSAVALSILTASLGAYLVLFVGDLATGVFAAFGVSQVAILSFVMAVALGLLLLGRWAARRNLLG